ncbi:hypothetical protein VB776_07650 [Arcicella sp. DC2W]|uniref:Lipoprotein n=1 Tax=Arcicella gelida TaxID=2984195 RepID=A0ABU5S3H2_9BACT|nr:hypothetical protein [Arcicella sp. DC2W]MEA5402783.1 hypothetical protein [Arcicella sp. DC2W]
MKIINLTRISLLLISIFMVACSSTAEVNDTKIETASDAINAYSAKNFQLIGIEAHFRYGNKIYRWYKGKTANWLGNRYEKYITLDLKTIFDSTATFQIIDHGTKVSEIQWTDQIKIKDDNSAFEILKKIGTRGLNQKDTAVSILKALYSNRKIHQIDHQNSTVYFFPLLFPHKHTISFHGDTLNVYYDNKKSDLGAEFLTCSFLLSQ